MPDTEALATGLAVDLVDVDRIRGLARRWGEGVLDRLLTPGELAATRGRRGILWDSVAARIAAKEAIKKLLGSHGELARWTEVEVRTGQYGEPHIQLHGCTRRSAERCGFGELLVSVSHEKGIAIVIVLASRIGATVGTHGYP